MTALRREDCPLWDDGILSSCKRGIFCYTKEVRRAQHAPRFVSSEKLDEKEPSVCNDTVDSVC